MGNPTTVEIEDFKLYRKTAVQKMRPYAEGEDVTAVSISAPDRENGSPKVGDMIAVNATDPADQWLIAAKFFADNYELVT